MIAFEVAGKPEPQGSARAFTNPKTGKAIITSDNPQLKSWRNAVAAAASGAMAGRELLRGPIQLTVEFGMPRIQSHFGRHGLLPSAPVFHTTKPDVDKLLRAVQDSLTATVFGDDSQVCDIGRAIKIYTDPPVTRVWVREIEVLDRSAGEELGL